MNILRSALITLLFSSIGALAAPASEKSVKELLAVTHAQKVVDGLLAQIDAQMTNGIRHELKGQQPTAKQQQAIEKMRKKMVAVVQGELSWEKLEPTYLRIYSESFTEEEVAGMLAFYKTTAGQAVINKMPTLMQTTMREVQTMMARASPQLRKVQEEFIAELKAAGH